MTAALARLIVHGAAWLAPARLRSRWREEWLAELGATPRGHLVHALGAPWDALAARWTTTSPSDAAGWRSGWATDVRQTTHALRRSPGHVALVVACLGVGLAASIGVFSLVNSLLYGEQPGIRDRHSLVRIYLGYADSRGTERIAGGATVNANPLTRADFTALRDHGPALSSVAAEGDLDMAVILDGQATGVIGALVSGEYFSTLGTTAQAGRLLTEADDQPGAAPVAVIGDYFWRTHLNARPDVVGHSLIISGHDVTIVGVAPPRFSGLQPVDPSEGPESGLQVWLPLADAPGWPGVPPEDAAWLSGVGRLAPAATREAALAQLNVAARRVEAANPAQRRDAHAVVRPHGFGPGDSPTDVLVIVVLFLSVPLSVLAIACANIANLQLARATDRTRELAVRLSLGGSRWQIVRLLVLESLLLTSAAVLVGAIGAVVVLRLLGSAFPMAIPLDWRVATFAVGLAAVVTIVTGLAPAWLVLRRAIAAGLGASGRSGGPAHSRLRHALVVLQVALSVALLFIGALFVRSLDALNRGIPDLAREIVVTDLELRQAAGYSRTEARRFAEAVQTRLAADARVAANGFADFRPAGGGVAYTRPEAPERDLSANGGYVTPQWFEVVRARVLAGRLLDARDAGQPVIVVNETLTRRLGVEGLSAIGTTLSVVHTTRDGSNEQPVRVQIVGVIADPLGYPDRRTEPAVYLPMPVEPPTSLVHLMRASDPDAAMADLRRVMASVDPRLPWTQSATIAARITREISPLRYVALSVGAFGTLALVLAVIGLYAVLAYIVSLRRREIGVRVAIGAGPRDVVSLVVRQSVRLVLAGGVSGLAIAVPLAFAIRAALIGISPIDPLALGPTLVALAGVAVVAAAVPARRAARIDPVRALRDD